MKTLREILLERHAPANEKLDAIRQEAVRAGLELRWGERTREPSFSSKSGSRGRSPHSFEAMVVYVLRSALSGLIAICSQPSPRAWVALAGVWVVILTVHFSLRDATKTASRESLPPSPQVVAVLQQQKRLLAELIGQSSAPEAGPQKPLLPRPRSERCTELRMT